MQELIKINYDTDQPTVSARELHEKLNIGTAFKDWFPRMCEYGFESEKDFNMLKNERVQIEGNREVRREITDYEITVDMAKQICMIQRTPEGKQCRQYLIDLEKVWNTPEQVMARALKMADKMIEKLKGDNQKLIEEVNVKDQVIGELKPKADYTDKILQNKGLVTITQIAKDYGMSGTEMNRKLHDLGIQFRQSGQWLLYSRYHGLGYTHSETVDIVRADGRPDVKMNTKWTQKGRLFLYDKLKDAGVIPVIERK